MANICPQTNLPVLYTECLECEDRTWCSLKSPHDTTRNLSRKDYEDALLRVSKLSSEVRELRTALDSKLKEVAEALEPIQKDLLSVVIEEARAEKTREFLAKKEGGRRGGC